MQKGCVPNLSAADKKGTIFSEGRAEQFVEDNKDLYSTLCTRLQYYPEEREKCYPIFIRLIESLCNTLLNTERRRDALDLFGVGLDLYPDSPELFYLLACVLLRVGKNREALEYALKCYKSCKADPRSFDLFCEVSHSLVDRWHFPMLNDSRRNEAYNSAIKKAVADGFSSVLDIGAGSGLLSLMAHRCGGDYVIGCESDDFMFELCENVLKTNSASNIAMINCHSSSMKSPDDFPQEINLVVTETFDSGLFGEDILKTVHHVWTNICKQNENSGNGYNPKQKIIPAGADIFGCIAECDYIAKQTKGFLDSSHPRRIVSKLQEPYLSEKLSCILGGCRNLTDWQKIMTVDFNSLTDTTNIMNGYKDGVLEFQMTEEGRCDCFVLSYKLYLDDSTSIDTCPSTDSCWENAIYPINNLGKTAKGEMIRAEMNYDDCLHFTLTSDLSATNHTSDEQLINCLNSKEYKMFYNHIADRIICARNELDNEPLKILDLCPFPQSALRMHASGCKTVLYIESRENKNLLTECGPKISLWNDGISDLDYIFYWPFTREGRLKSTLLSDVEYYRKAPKLGGVFHPSFLNVNFCAIQSDKLLSMTRSDDSNTCGVKIEEIFNMFKTRHHVDLPVHGLPDLKVMSAEIFAMRIQLIQQPSTTEDSTHQAVVSETKNSSQTEDSDIKTKEKGRYLMIGGEVNRRVISFKAKDNGYITGFVYWFTLLSLEEESRSLEMRDTSEVSKHIPGVSKFENIKMTKGDASSGIFLDRAPREDSEPTPNLTEKDSIASTFSTWSLDPRKGSPVNQAVILLDDEIKVTTNQEVQAEVNYCDGAFSFNIID